MVKSSRSDRRVWCSWRESLVVAHNYPTVRRRVDAGGAAEESGNGETPANFFLPFTKAETWPEMALRSARSSSYLGSVLPSKQVVAQDPVTEGADADAEAILFLGRDDWSGSVVQRFEMLPDWSQINTQGKTMVVYCQVSNLKNVKVRRSIDIRKQG